MKKRPIIGILNTLKSIENHPYDSLYKTVDLYVKKIENIDCVPLGLMDIENNQEVLDICDAFILPGGNRITRDHYYIIRHCIKNNKPLLGICLGMQSMVLYDYLSNEFTEEVSIIELYNKYQEIKHQNTSILKRIENAMHGGALSSGLLEASLLNVLNSKHVIQINESSLLYDIYKQRSKEVISMHQYGVYHSTKLFKEIAHASDSVLEAIQYGEDGYFILGVQFHVEAEQNNLIFNRLKEEIIKRSK